MKCCDYYPAIYVLACNIVPSTHIHVGEFQDMQLSETFTILLAHSLASVNYTLTNNDSIYKMTVHIDFFFLPKNVSLRMKHCYKH